MRASNATEYVVTVTHGFPLGKLQFRKYILYAQSRFTQNITETPDNLFFSVLPIKIKCSRRGK